MWRRLQLCGKKSALPEKKVHAQRKSWIRVWEKGPRLTLGWGPPNGLCGPAQTRFIGNPIHGSPKFLYSTLNLTLTLALTLPTLLTLLLSTVFNMVQEFGTTVYRIADLSRAQSTMIPLQLVLVKLTVVYISTILVQMCLCCSFVFLWWSFLERKL